LKTLLLDQATWDLTKDASGNIAVAANPYAIAQNVACACRLFLGELWYDTTQGVPYLQQILGLRPPPEFVKAQLTKASLSVPEVVQVQVFLTSFDDRELGGQIHITDSRGISLVVGSVTLAGAVPWYVNAAVPY